MATRKKKVKEEVAPETKAQETKAQETKAPENVAQEDVKVEVRKDIPKHKESLEELKLLKHKQGLAGLDGIEDAILGVFPEAVSNDNVKHPVKVGDKLLSVREIVDALEGRYDEDAKQLWHRYSKSSMSKTGATVYYLMAINEKEQEG